jgi:hypothetical protein
MTAEDIFNEFVFEGKCYAKADVEAAALEVRKRLTHSRRQEVNDALLARLAEAKENHAPVEQGKDMLRDSRISTLVNTLVLVNEGLLHNVITKAKEQKPHLQHYSAEELYALALAGRDSQQADVHGMMGAILHYDYRKYGVHAFTTYLTRAIDNSLHQTLKQQKNYQRIDSRTRRIPDDAEPQWIDRNAESPEAAAINHELLEVVRSVLPRLHRQQRITAEFIIGRILETGKRPTFVEIARDAYETPVSKQRAAQVMIETMNNLERAIQEKYPQLAEEGVNGWKEFRKVIKPPGRDSNGHHGNGRA